MTKLKYMDEKLINDPLIYDACIYMMDIKGQKSHMVKKGNIHNKKLYLSSNPAYCGLESTQEDLMKFIVAFLDG